MNKLLKTERKKRKKINLTLNLKELENTRANKTENKWKKRNNKDYKQK